MRKGIKFLLIGTTISIVVVLLFVLLVRGKYKLLYKYVYMSGNETMVRVSYGKYGFQIKEGFVVLDKSGFKFDSGCSSSYLNPDTLQSFKGFDIIAHINISDANGVIKEYPLYYFRKIKTEENFVIKNMVAYPCNGTVNGLSVLGMDVISAANWHFCFKDSCVDVFHVGQTTHVPMSAICLSYEQTKNPLISLTIGEKCFGHGLLDMGMVDWDICLADSAFSSLLQVCAPENSIVDTSFSLNSYKLVKTCTFDSLRIFDSMFANVSVRCGVKNLIGMDFFRRFEHMFWDSGHKKVYLWNDEE